ncbi:MAG: hypothetical protein JWP29_3281 [Rhodoferax sp.]|nr:hypothetical protein [Rhodoferax sp.]
MSDKTSNFDLFADAQDTNESAVLVAQPVETGSAVCTIEGQSGCSMQVDLLGVRGRKAIHADSAARKRAYRASKARIDYADDPAIVAKLAEIAGELDCSRQDLMASLVRFALTNRNWKQVGLYGRRGQA